MKTNQKVTILLRDFEIVAPELGKIIRVLRKSVIHIAPDALEKVMYGGIMFTLPKRMFCGLFLRRNHVSVEFDFGCFLNDSDKNLEGTGERRRHLKIHNVIEIKTKKTENFIRQSYKLKLEGDQNEP